MRLIYIAGPLHAENMYKREQNIRHAEEAVLYLMKLGAAVHCPHSQSRYFDGALPEEKFIEADLEILKRCDALFLLTDWKSSKGANIELDFFSETFAPIGDSLSSAKRIFYEGDGAPDLKQWIDFGNGIVK